VATIAYTIDINAAFLSLSILIWTRVIEVLALRDCYQGNNFLEGQGITIDFCELPHVRKEEKDKQHIMFFEPRPRVSF
jgi:hypothetical protein